MKSILVAVLVLGASGTAWAQRQSPVKGSTLMAACTGNGKVACDAYLDGFSDAVLEEGHANAVACIPVSATGTELRDVLVKYLRDHPEMQSQRASTIVKNALSKAYACRK